MPRITISFAESALADLDEVRAWYAEQGVPEVGERMVAEVLQRAHALADHPDMGRVVPEFEQPFLRELIHRPFRIVTVVMPAGCESFVSGVANAYCVCPRVTN